MWLLFNIITLIATGDDVLLCQAECDTRIVPAFAFTAQQIPLTSSILQTYANPPVRSPQISPIQNAQQDTAIIEFPDLMMMQVPAKWSLTGGEEEMPYPPAPPYPVEKCLTATGMVMPKSFEHPTHKSQLTVTTSSYSRCRDTECQFCSFMLTQRLREMGLLSEQQYNEIRKSLGFINGAAFPNVAEKITCKRFRFSAIQDRLKNLARKANNTETVLNSTMAQALQSVSHLGLEEWNRTESTNFRRFRREISEVEIGKRYRIDCIKRGEPVDGSEWLGLCNVCWVWRKLPENYFPRYVNELVCDNDTKCLSGWGTCKQRHRNLEIMKNMGTAEEPHWRPITLNAASFCDCFVRYGTVMHSFIAA
ncbi:Uncharacterized protein T07_2358 [Trichinella nelsoni]|uniref:Uncharacterized protein n=1 Tax=Trichinella nelsoni TaxID=6336 RepID=A0A0V0SJ97_9BILA|nr:Uncharacterized protein T07_2358 [Trichinella nelsoni]